MTEEDPLACRALLQLTEIIFTDRVPTMAVTISKSPALLINLNFCREQLESENDVKAVLLHEFLHVLLLHTGKYEMSNPLLNIALDAIINAIIYRYKGMEYAGFFSRFYKWEKMSFLLRPAAGEKALSFEWGQLHSSIYTGHYCADDLYELLEYLKPKISRRDIEKIILIGDHTKEAVSEEMKKVLDGILKKMNGTLIWNKPSAYGLGDKLTHEKQEIQKYRQNRWNKITMNLLRRSLLPDEKTKKEEARIELILPVLSSTDRRAMARYRYSGIVPFSVNEVRTPSASHLASVYLDVSGSMNAEIGELISLLWRFRSCLKLPLWVFSNQVSEARFIEGKLVFHSTGGTSIGPVFEHIRKNKVMKSLIITDGYTENIWPEMLKDIRKENIQVLISSGGNPQVFDEAGIKYSQLPKL